ISSQLDNEIGWLQNHMDSLEDIINPSLTQLFEISDRLERKEADYRELGYRSMAYNLIGKMRAHHQQFVTANNNISPYVKMANDKAGFLKNWIDESQSKGHQALQYILAAEALIEEIDGRDQRNTQKAF